MIKRSATPYAFSIKKNCRRSRNHSVINTENGEKRNLKQFKGLKTPQMRAGTRNRRESHAGFSEKDLKVTCVWSKKNSLAGWKRFYSSCSCQSAERSFYGKGKKSDIPDENLLSSTNKMSKKVMVSAAILWYGVTKTFW